MKIFVSCAIGLEPVLASELERILSLDSVTPARAGAWLEITLEQTYRIALWSRVASRVLIPIYEADATPDRLYDSGLKQDWSQYMRPGARLAIDFSGKNKHIRHSRFGALRVKDAIADWFGEQGQEQPHLDKEEPQIRLSARIQKSRVSVALDFTGSGLHRRGYRQRQGIAPLRENLAAGLLYRAGWPEIASSGGALCDPMCGSGTFLIEAALMALDGAPGIGREFWGFDAWPGHDAALWAALQEEARCRFSEGCRSYQGRLYGSDSNSYMTRMVMDNARNAGVDEWIEVKTADATEVHAPPAKELEGKEEPEGIEESEGKEGHARITDSVAGLLISNPPYGERMGDEAQIALLYERLGENLKVNFPNWKAAVLAANVEYGRRMGIHSHKQYQVDNGNLACVLVLFDLGERNHIQVKREIQPSQGAVMVANRIRKNMARLNGWLAREAVQAFRVYDADIPEYAAAVDIYQTNHGRYAVVQEYAAPKTIDAGKAKHRLNELLTGVGSALTIEMDQVVLKSRQRQRGAQQYDKQDEDQFRGLLVQESDAVLELDLGQYLDTGLFLDHRAIRRQIGSVAQGKRFLNLFCYTATASVHAALGGASGSLSVDMSNTYLNWAERNYRHNRIDRTRHRLLREDCLKFLERQSVDPDEKFDLIFLDPPSFSNSAKMDAVLDIQRDHVELIRQAMALLAEGGELIFSTNLRRFRMDQEALSAFVLGDDTQSSLDPDFQRNQRIHQCWRISHASE